MVKGILTVAIIFLSIMQVDAQLGVMKMVGKNLNDYSRGFGAFGKGGYPVSQGSDVSLEIECTTSIRLSRSIKQYRDPE